MRSVVQSRSRTIALVAGTVLSIGAGVALGAAGAPTEAPVDETRQDVRAAGVEDIRAAALTAPSDLTTASPDGDARPPADTAALDAHADRTARRPAPAAPGIPAGIWDRLAQCESGGNWASTVGTFEGGLQFHPKTWDAYKPSGYPNAAYQATRDQQILVGKRVQAAQGWGAWPVCSRKVGLR